MIRIAVCFRPALAALKKLAARGLVRADCESLERRHNLGRGTLVVLDVVNEATAPSYEQRRAMLESLLPCDAVFAGNPTRSVPINAVCLARTVRVESHARCAGVLPAVV